MDLELELNKINGVVELVIARHEAEILVEWLEEQIKDMPAFMGLTFCAGHMASFAMQKRMEIFSRQEERNAKLRPSHLDGKCIHINFNNR